ncbi:hypothetical protein RB195_001603 [Necator americanus]|uniref:Uncharacterized protein n=1 Tax=Necator americanus TaxID=51031 RepID=A0ABR1DF30_NECAM
MYKKCVSNVASIMVNISARGQPFLYTAAVLFSGSYNRGSLCFSRSSCCIIPSSNNGKLINKYQGRDHVLFFPNSFYELRFFKKAMIKAQRF